MRRMPSTAIAMRLQRMKIKDKNNGQNVDVAHADCAARGCYWPRPDPGIFTQGQGYRTRPGKTEWVCGTRHAYGCPDVMIKKVPDV